MEAVREGRLLHAGHGADAAATAIEAAGSEEELTGSMPSPPRRDVRERELITAYGALGTPLGSVYTFHACARTHHVV